MEQRAHRFTEARNNLTAIIDAVQRNNPQIIRKRKNSEDDVLIIKSSLLRTALSLSGSGMFKVRTEKEADGSWTIMLEPFGLVVNAATKQKAIDQLLHDVRVYADEFMENRSLYLRSANRKNHFLYVLQVLLCANDAELKETLQLA